MKKLTILLLGSTGFLGKKLKIKLEKNYKIITKNSKTLNLLDFNKLNNFFNSKKFDIILNCSWLVNSTADDNFIRLKNSKKNLKIGKNLFFLAQKYQIKYFINISSINVYKPSKFLLSEKNLFKKTYQSNSPEGIAKLNLIKLFNKVDTKKFKYLNLIFSNLYGFKLRKNLLFLDKVFHNIYLKKKYQIFLPKNFDLKIDYLYIEDAVIAVNFFMKKLINQKIKDKNINIASGKQYSLKNLIDIIKKEKKIAIKYFEIKSKNKLSLKPSIQLAKKYNWKPEVSIKDGIKKTAKIYKKF